MSRIFLLVLLFVSSFGFGVAETAAAETVSIARVHPGWRDAASFRRISEYFTGRENPSGQIILRTDPSQRAGFYFLIRTEQDTARDAQIRLTYFVPGEADPRVLTRSVHLPAGHALINLGLTGADWPNPEQRTVAWHLELLDPAGKVLDAKKSYLWDQPAG